LLNNAVLFELFEIVYTYKINGKIIKKLFGTKKFHHFQQEVRKIRSFFTYSKTVTWVYIERKALILLTLSAMM